MSVKKPTERQLGVLQDLGIIVPDYWNRQNCSNALNYLLVRKPEVKARRIRSLNDYLGWVGEMVLTVLDKEAKEHEVVRVYVKSFDDKVDAVQDYGPDHIPHPFKLSLTHLDSKGRTLSVSAGLVRKKDGEYPSKMAQTELEQIRCQRGSK